MFKSFSLLRLIYVVPQVLSLFAPVYCLAEIVNAHIKIFETATFDFNDLSHGLEFSGDFKGKIRLIYSAEQKKIIIKPIQFNESGELIIKDKAGIELKKITFETKKASPKDVKSAFTEAVNIIGKNPDISVEQLKNRLIISGLIKDAEQRKKIEKLRFQNAGLIWIRGNNPDLPWGVPKWCSNEDKVLTLAERLKFDLENSSQPSSDNNFHSSAIVVAEKVMRSDGQIEKLVVDNVIYSYDKSIDLKEIKLKLSLGGAPSPELPNGKMVVYLLVKKESQKTTGYVSYCKPHFAKKVDKGLLLTNGKNNSLQKLRIDDFRKQILQSIKTQKGKKRIKKDWIKVE